MLLREKGTFVGTTRKLTHMPLQNSPLGFMQGVTLPAVGSDI